MPYNVPTWRLSDLLSTGSPLTILFSVEMFSSVRITTD